MSGELVSLDPRMATERVLGRVLEAGARLRAMPTDRIIERVSAAAAVLADPRSRAGAQAREHIVERSSLSPQNVEITLGSSLAELRAERLSAAIAAFRRAHAGRKNMPSRMVGMVLAGNVYTACLRPIAWALLLRVPVAIKPSSQDEGLAELLAVSLSESDPEIGDCLGLLRFSRDEPAMLATLGDRCDVLHAWGSDRSIAAIRAGLPATTTFVPHGSGLGAAIVSREALSSRERAERAATQLATDIALYDQRGCLSPHVVLIESGGAIAPVELARILSQQALATIGREVPRGPIPPEVGAAQVQWRGVGVARGELFEGDGWSVTFEGREPLRLSPGWRNVAAYECASIPEACARLATFGAHLKALGVAGSIEVRAKAADALPPPLCPRVCEVGAMQHPGILAAVDGEPPWAGLVRLVDID